DDDGDGFAEEHCDGSTPSMQPVEEASADYQGSDAFLSVAALRFGSEDDASAAYEELVATTSGCSSEDGLSVDEGASTDIGDEGMSWELEFGEQGGGVRYVVRAGDEMWYLSLLGGETVEESVLTAYATAVEG